MRALKMVTGSIKAQSSLTSMGTVWVKCKSRGRLSSFMGARGGRAESTNSSGDQLQGQAEQRASCQSERWAVERGISEQST